MSIKILRTQLERTGHVLIVLLMKKRTSLDKPQLIIHVNSGMGR